MARRYPAISGQSCTYQVLPSHDPRDRLRAAELLARWLDQIGPDASVQNNVGFIHQQADISLEHLLELERLLDLTGAAERQAQRRP